jgi:hypothetical protein
MAGDFLGYLGQGRKYPSALDALCCLVYPGGCFLRIQIMLSREIVDKATLSQILAQASAEFGYVLE